MILLALSARLKSCSFKTGLNQALSKRRKSCSFKTGLNQRILRVEAEIPPSKRLRLITQEVNQILFPFRMCASISSLSRPGKAAHWRNLIRSVQRLIPE